MINKEDIVDTFNKITYLCNKGMSYLHKDSRSDAESMHNIFEKILSVVKSDIKLDIEEISGDSYISRKYLIDKGLNETLSKIKSLELEIYNLTNQLVYSNAVRDQVLKDKIDLTKKLNERIDHTECWDKHRKALRELEKDNDSLLKKISVRKELICRSLINRVKK